MRAAARAKIAPGPERFSTIPAKAGPTRPPIPSIQLVTTLDAVSSSGVRVTPGASDMWAGRVSDVAIEAAVAAR
jgi:hypothetical protein